VAGTQKHRGIAFLTVVLAFLGLGITIWQGLVAGRILYALEMSRQFYALTFEDQQYFRETVLDEAESVEFFSMIGAAGNFLLGLTIVLVAVISGLAMWVGRSAERKGRGFWPFYLFSLILTPIVTGLIIGIIAPPQPAINNDRAILKGHE
jgi:hypothetical protein